ncbi:TnsD family Tn7-like transposition protein [Clostridium sp.]|jgi:hypothetical protein|uniref:TnsD family Tn7-like transposition protein n=1 Tax=Clostridium sp. TaxID=1506 RepID=UPI00258D0F00|nr:TnsD family Tn7-like transposition protein [Clostridium sp.]MDF2503026.1 hypothetical protein [Clostridium sp.]
MLSFFTDPYPNELLFSALSRYHFYSGNKSYSDTNYDLYGISSLNNNKDYLDDLISNLGGSYDKNELILNHTISPFYRLFYGYKSFDLCFNRQLFFCPECAKNDIEKYGEAYFHREHQLDLLICSKHRVALKPYGDEVTWNTINNYNQFDVNKVDLNNIQFLDDSKYDNAWQVAKMTSELLSYRTNKYINCDVLENYYKKVLIEKRLSTRCGTICRDSLDEEIINFYRDEGLNFLDKFYKEHKYISWNRRRLDDSCRPNNLIQHLILVNFFGKSINNLIEDINRDYKPFGEGPWACINGVCSYRDKFVIKKVDIKSTDDDLDNTFGIFECKHCGFKYSRYVNHNKNILLHICNNGQRYYIKEVLNYGKKDISARNSNKKTDKKTLDSYKKRIVELMKSNPNISRTEIARKYSNIYELLLKYDREWWEKNAPSPKQNKNNIKLTGTSYYVNAPLKTGKQG